MSTNEHKLLNAITKVTDLVNGGESPTEAVFKVASDMQLRAGDVRLVSLRRTTRVAPAASRRSATIRWKRQPTSTWRMPAT